MGGDSNPGVVDQDVDVAQFLQDVLNHPVDLGGVAPWSCRPSADTSRAVSSAVLRTTSLTTTSAPALANERAMPRPIP